MAAHYGIDAIKIETVSEHENRPEPEFLFIDPLGSSNQNEHTNLTTAERNPLLVEVDVDQVVKSSSYSEYFDGTSDRDETFWKENRDRDTRFTNEIIKITPKLEETDVEEEYSDEVPEETPDSIISSDDQPRHCCDQCDAKFSRRTNLRYHIEAKHMKLVYKCTICSARMTYRNRHRLHMRKHTEEGLFKCSHCYCKFNNAIYHQQHEQSHIDSPNQQYFAHMILHSDSVFAPAPKQSVKTLADNERCREISKIAKVKYQLMDSSPVSLGLGAKKREYKCNQCDASYGRSTQLKYHIDAKHLMLTYVCTICNAQMVYRNHFQTHMRKHTEKGLFECSHCYCKFNNHILWMEHELSHEDSPDKEFFANMLMNPDSVPLQESENLSDSGQCDNSQYVNEGIDKDSEYLEAQLDTNDEAKEGSNSSVNEFCEIKMEEYKCTEVYDQVENSTTEQNSKKWYQCNQCDAKYPRRINLTYHIEAKHMKLIYKCTICRARMTYRNRHRFHMRKHIEDGLFECSHCYCKFKNAIYHQQHEQSHIDSPNQRYFAHMIVNPTFEVNCLIETSRRGRQQDQLDKTKKYLCKICERPFSNQQDVNRHEATHIHPDDYEFECEICSRKFSLLSGLKHHQRVHSTNDERKYGCSYCEQRFKNRETCILHERRVHTGERPYKCSECPKNFSSKHQLKGHTLAIHSTDRRYSCQECRKLFPSKGALTRHIRECHSIYFCCYCCKSFGTTTGLKMHEAKHVGNKATPFQCFDCKKMLQTRDGLKSHLKSHMKLEYPKTKIIRFHCDRCSYGCKNKSTMDIHLKIHDDIRDFQCPNCPKTFHSKHGLIRHRVMHTFDRPYQCEECPLQFKTKASLNRHNKIHLGIFGFNCEHCEKKFRNKGNYAAHIQIHTGTKAFKCLACSREFARSGDYNRHVKTHENV